MLLPLEIETLLLWEFVLDCEKLWVFFRVGEVEIQQTFQLCRTGLATLSPFLWIRKGLEKGRKNTQEQRNSSGVRVKGIRLLKLQIRSQKQRLQGCLWFFAKGKAVELLHGLSGTHVKTAAPSTQGLCPPGTGKNISRYEFLLSESSRWL